jgi:hypothetical protein
MIIGEASMHSGDEVGFKDILMPFDLVERILTQISIIITGKT